MRRNAPLVADALPAAVQRRGITTRQMFATCVIGTAVLALFASRDLPGWADRLGDAPHAHRLRGLAVSWDAAMERLHLTDPHEAMRVAMRRFLDWQWDADNR